MSCERSPRASPPGRTCLGVAGPDFCVVAADTRMSKGFTIHTREKSKAVEL